MTSSNLLTLLTASALLLSPSTPFTLPIATKHMKSSPSCLSASSSSDENKPRLQETLNDLSSSHLNSNYMDEPTSNLPLADTSEGTQQHNNQLNEEDELTTTSTNNNRAIEFITPQPTIPSPRNLARLELEHRLQSIYTPVNTNEYWELQDSILQLSSDLQVAKSTLSRRTSRRSSRSSSYNRGEDNNKSSGIQAIETMLRRAQAKDAQHVYRVTSKAAVVAGRMGRYEEAERYGIESERAKMMLPQFNLEGLWVGKYGSHGFEMINVTYSGDQLIAYKVTGDQNIPRGEISFTADLSPDSHMEEQGLDPIVLSEGSAKKWGTKRLPRYPGKGHAAEPNFQNPTHLEGQLVVIGPGDYFSFAWIPLEHQIFFGRPSPELTLKMLREGGSASLTAGMGAPVPTLESGTHREMTDYLTRCLEVTNSNSEEDVCEGKAFDGCGIWHGNDDDEELCFFQ